MGLLEPSLRIFRTVGQPNIHCFVSTGQLSLRSYLTTTCLDRLINQANTRTKKKVTFSLPSSDANVIGEEVTVAVFTRRRCCSAIFYTLLILNFCCHLISFAFLNKVVPPLLPYTQFEIKIKFHRAHLSNTWTRNPIKTSNTHTTY